jgi:hypothetical protein
LNEKNNRAHRHRSKEFWGAQDLILKQLKNIIKIKIVARGTTLKAFGEKFRRVRKTFSTANASFYSTIT